jgi:hypothetical protein
VSGVDGQPLTAAEEFELYVTKGVVPSTYAISRTLGEDRGEVLARLASPGDDEAPRAAVAIPRRCDLSRGV